MDEKIIARNGKVTIGIDVHTRSHVVAVKVGQQIAHRSSMPPNREAWPTDVY